MNNHVCDAMPKGVSIHDGEVALEVTREVKSKTSITLKDVRYCPWCGKSVKTKPMIKTSVLNLYESLHEYTFVYPCPKCNEYPLVERIPAHDHYIANICR